MEDIIKKLQGKDIQTSLLITLNCFLGLSKEEMVTATICICVLLVAGWATYFISKVTSSFIKSTNKKRHKSKKKNPPSAKG